MDIDVPLQIWVVWWRLGIGQSMNEMVKWLMIGGKRELGRERRTGQSGQGELCIKQVG